MQRCKLLESLSRHDGGEQIQYAHPLESSSLHFHDQAQKLSRSEPVERPGNANLEKIIWKYFQDGRRTWIDTYIIPFNIFVTPEFSKAHNVAMDNLDHHFFVKGDTSK